MLTIHSSVCPNQSGDHADSWCTAIAYINAHLAQDLSITAISNELEIGQYYFSRLFKQSIGASPYQYAITQAQQQYIILNQQNYSGAEPISTDASTFSI
jgi:YesN/AraC family two-component response regulator